RRARAEKRRVRFDEAVMSAPADLAARDMMHDGVRRVIAALPVEHLIAAHLRLEHSLVADDAHFQVFVGPWSKHGEEQAAADAVFVFKADARMIDDLV